MTNANPNKKSSIGISNGNRMPLVCRLSYTTIGALSLVNQPSTRIWNPITISIESQYAGRRKSPVRNTVTSSAPTASAAITAGTV